MRRSDRASILETGESARMLEETSATHQGFVSVDIAVVVRLANR